MGGGPARADAHPAPAAGRAGGAAAWAQRGSCAGGGVCRTDLHLAEGDLPEYAVVDERYAYAIPLAFDDEHAAPLLCAGIIGFRALRRANVPSGGRLGIYGFGASAHLAAQVALFEGATVHVLTRSPQARRHALELGAASAGAADDLPPEPLDAAILSPPRENWCRSPLPSWTAAAPWRSLASTSVDIPPLHYAIPLFQCAVLQRSRGRQ